MASPTAKLRFVAGVYGIVALAQVAISVLFLEVIDWNIGNLLRNIDVTGSLLLDVAAMFVLNVALAAGAWRFADLSKHWQILEISVAFMIPTLMAVVSTWQAYLWISGRAFADIDRAALASGLGGRSLLAIGYAALALSLLRAYWRAAPERNGTSR